MENPAPSRFEQASGYRREEIIGSNFWKLGLWPNDREWQEFQTPDQAGSALDYQSAALQMHLQNGCGWLKSAGLSGRDIFKSTSLAV
jgi:PAS domain-containing protein